MSAAASFAEREEKDQQPRDEPLTARMASRESLLLRVGVQHTTAMRTDTGQTLAYRIISHTPALLAAAQAAAARASGTAAARVIRAAAEQVVDRARLESLFVAGCPVIATPGIACAVITLAGGARATIDQIQIATDRLGIDWVRQQNEAPDRPNGGPVESMLIGAAVLGAILTRLGVDEILAEAQVP
jgi:hypothetical protein